MKLKRDVFPGANVSISSPRCHLIHNGYYLLKLGPFKLEVKRVDPIRIVLHEFLTTSEVNHII